MAKSEPEKGRKVFGISVDRDLMREFQRLALDLDRFVNDVMEEAMQDALKKYRDKRKNWPLPRPMLPITKQKVAQDELYKLWHGMSNDLFEAEEAHTFSWEIGQNADAINAASFGLFFGSLQRITSKCTYIAVGRLFEVPRGSYKIHSIPSALIFIERHADVLSIFDRHQITQAAPWKLPSLIAMPT